MADQRKRRQNVGLENTNMTSYYDVTDNAHQIQMTPHARHWMKLPPWKFSACATVLSHVWKHQSITKQSLFIAALRKTLHNRATICYKAIMWFFSCHWKCVEKSDTSTDNHDKHK